MPTSRIPLAPFLEEIQIASPCSADWAKMEGDDRVRFCRECHKNVYNLSTVSRAEAERLIRDVEGVNCVRLYRRADGTIITDDCPVGMRPTRELIYLFGSLLAGVAMIIAAVTSHAMEKDTEGISALWRIEPIATVMKWIWPTPPAPPPSRCVMGKR
jgi:hypothetical protein